MNRRTLWMVAFGLVALAAPSFSFAQDRQAGQGGGGDFRERRMNELKDKLGAKDDEWTVLKPRIEKVNNARYALMAGMFGGRGGGPGGGRGGDRGGNNNNSSSSSDRG